MSKRLNNASPSKAKRRKVEGAQNTLNSFFKPKSTPLASTTRQEPVIIDVDALDSSENERELKPQPESTSTKTPSPQKPQTSKSVFFSPKGKEKAPQDTHDLPPLETDPGQYTPPQPSSNTGAPAPFYLLSKALVTLSQTRSRICIINTLTNLLRTTIVLYPASLLPTMYLLSNSLKPSFIPVELGIGSTVISQAIRQISGLSAAALRKLYNTTGDPGDVAFEAKSNIRTLIPHPSLTIPGVYASLLKISACKGQGANKEKQKIVEKLLLSATGEEVRYLTRILCQNLRVGAVRTSILTSLARALLWTESSAPTDPPSRYPAAEALLKQVFARHPTYDAIVPAVLEDGLKGLAERVLLTVGTPLLPMLGSPTRSLQEIYERLGELPFTAEFKYDGQRAQVHGWSDVSGDYTVKLFSRHLEDMTSKYPDVVTLMRSMMEDNDIVSFIMDSEIVAIDTASGALRSFQDLSGRPRKDVRLDDIQIDVCVFAFDLMYLDGESLLNRSFRQRRELLRTRFTRRRDSDPRAHVAQFDFVESCDSQDGKDVIEELLSRAVEAKCEGLMVKLLDKAPQSEDGPSVKQARSKMLPSTYEPDIRTSAWLKLKKDYIDGMGDSIDVIPIGAWHGNGRKAQWWSPILLALWDPEKGLPVAVCKCMSGFTDNFYKALNESYSLSDPRTCSRTAQWQADFGGKCIEQIPTPSLYDRSTIGFRPDVYFRPNEIWEIRGADITLSPVSTAAQGLVSSSRGLSIRFPRFIRKRDDKGIADASQPEFLAGLWRKQANNIDDGGGGDELIDVTLSSEVESEEDLDEEFDGS